MGSVKPARKQTSPEMSSLAALTLNAGQPEWMPDDYWMLVKRLCACVMGQDETPKDAEDGA